MEKTRNFVYITKQPAMKHILFLIIPMLLLTSCNHQAKTENYSGSTMEYTLAAEQPAAAAEEATDKKAKTESTPTKSATEKTSAKIIKTASIEFQVKNTAESHQRITALLKKYDAYFANDNHNTSSYRIDNNMVIRVPADKFDALLEELMKESIYTNYKNITAEDVTEQFVDTEARLKTKREVEQRYIALLKEAKKVQDILDIEDKLRVIREEIEATEGKLKLLNDKVNYSTIYLNTYQTLDYVPEPEKGFFSNVKEALIRGWRDLIGFVVSLIRLWPFLIAAGITVFWFIRRLRKKRA